MSINHTKTRILKPANFYQSYQMRVINITSYCYYEYTRYAMYISKIINRIDIKTGIKINKQYLVYNLHNL